MSPFELPDFDAHEAIHFFHDAGNRLTAIIAIHSTALGPAAGGCRCWNYLSPSAALTDALRLSRGMSYKNAMAGLPLGGGKAVMLDGGALTAASFEAFGRAVEQLDGRYVTAEDVGTSVERMQWVARSTHHVCGLPRETGGVGGDPSPKTASGVFHGIRESWQYLMRSDLRGVRVGVQGLGSVGAALCMLLREAGARLLVADIDAVRAQRVAALCGADVLSSREIIDADMDILAPCALGAVLNEQTIPRLKAKLVAGAANNQLATEADGERLRARGIWYAPDYVINAGGIIAVASEYLGEESEDGMHRRIARIPDTLKEIYAIAESSQLATSTVADGMARQRLGGKPRATQENEHLVVAS
jgi:leucine dehydrogenase